MHGKEKVATRWRTGAGGGAPRTGVGGVAWVAGEAAVHGWWAQVAAHRLRQQCTGGGRRRQRTPSNPSPTPRSGKCHIQWSGMPMPDGHGRGHDVLPDKQLGCGSGRGYLCLGSSMDSLCPCPTQPVAIPIYISLQFQRVGIVYRTIPIVD